VILGSDAVEKLNVKMNEEQFDVNNVIDIQYTDEENDNVADVDDETDNENSDDVVPPVDAGVSDYNDVHDDNDKTVCDPRKASAEMLKAEQRSDKSLAGCWSLAERQKAGYFIRDGILYRYQKMFGHEYDQLVLPFGRRAEVMKIAHQTFGGHLAAKKTKERIKLSFTWPAIATDVQKACESCHQCQKLKRVTVYDRVPIHPVPRDEVPYDCLVMDCVGPIFSNQKVEFNYSLVLCDSNTRYPFAIPLRSLSAKNVCQALIQVFQMTGIPSTIRSDCGSYFTSQLTAACLKYLGCSPNFNVPERPQQTGLCE